MSEISVLQFLAKTNMLTAKVVGDSMLPTLKDGEIVRIIKTENYEVGDIIMYVVADASIIHRVVDKVRARGHVFLKTKGDNCMFEDPFVPEIFVIGKLIR